MFDDIKAWESATEVDAAENHAGDDWTYALVMVETDDIIMATTYMGSSTRPT